MTGGSGPERHARRRSRGIRLAVCIVTTFAMLVLPSASQAYTPPGAYTGTGYYIYVCDAARNAGYSGDLNKFFESKRIHYRRAGGDPWGLVVPWGPNAGNSWQAAYSAPNDPEPKRNWVLWDDCSTGGGTLGIEHNNNDRTLPAAPLPGGGPGGTGWDWEGAVQKNEGLEFRRVEVEDNIRNYRTRRDGAEGARKHVDALWQVGGDIESGGFRGCNGWGQWVDAPSLGNGWKNGDNPFNDLPNDAFGLGSNDWDGGNAASEQYYRWGPAREYMPLMNSFGTAANPGATCRITGGESSYAFDASADVYDLTMRVFCNSRAPDTTHCRGTNAGLPARLREQGNSRSTGLTSNARIASSFVRVYVVDTRPPVTRITGGSMDAGGGVVGNFSHTKETLTFNASDNSGIRGIRVYVDGNLQPTLTRDFSNLCDHRFPTPCLESTAGRGPGGSADTSAIRFDADSLPPGNHRITVEVVSGSGDSSSDTARFRTVRPPIVNRFCDKSVTTGATIADCETDLPTGDNSGPGEPGAPPVAPLVPEATSGAAIFTYDLASNDRPSSSSMSPANCKVIEHVASGAAGGALSPRELNQVISITINLRGYISTGSTIGQQDLRATFGMPSRNAPRYRSSLGCDI